MVEPLPFKEASQTSHPSPSSPVSSGMRYRDHAWLQGTLEVWSLRRASMLGVLPQRGGTDAASGTRGHQLLFDPERWGGAPWAGQG